MSNRNINKNVITYPLFASPDGPSPHAILLVLLVADFVTMTVAALGSFFLWSHLYSASGEPQ